LFIPDPNIFHPGSRILHKKRDEKKKLPVPFSCFLWFQEEVFKVKKIIDPDPDPQHWSYRYIIFTGHCCGFVSVSDAYRVRRSIVHSVRGAGQAILMGSRGLPDQSGARGRPRDGIYISAIGGGVLAAMAAAKLRISSQNSHAPGDV
jgi:hypothetical protein